MKRLVIILGLALMASACDGGADESGDQRGDVDAGGAAGAAGAGAAGMSGAGGALAAAGGSAGSLGSAGGAAGIGSGGAGGAAIEDLPCPAYSWSPTSGSGCFKQPSPGVYTYGTKNGHPCSICSQPARPSGVPDCQDSGSSAICVLSCDECTFE